jgi:hypothetical protein
MKRRTRKWLSGLGHAAIGGAATAGAAWLTTLGVADLGLAVEKFSLRQLVVVVFCGGAASAFFYLKQKPLPDPQDDTRFQSKEPE